MSRDYQMPEYKNQNYVMPFGKYKGMELSVIYNSDENYLKWCANELNPNFPDKKVKEAKSKIEEFLTDMGY